jgi:putative intracellular protease/amidase
VDDTNRCSVINVMHRRFIETEAGAAVASRFLPTLNLRGTWFAALMWAASMYNKLKRLFIVLIVFISFPGLAFNQQPPSPSAVAAPNTTCCDVAPGGTYEFNQLTITVLATALDSTGGAPHGVARMRLAEGGATEEVTAGEGQSLNWHGYHVAIAAVHGPGEFRGGFATLRVASVASLPQCIGKTWKDGPAPWPCTEFAQQPPSPSAAPSTKLVPPAQGKIPVAFIIRPGAETIDFVGPWEAFQFAFRPSKGAMSMEDTELFKLYTVSDSKEPVRVSGGMKIIPDYTYAEAPEPKVVVIPGTTKSPEMLDWIRKVAKHSDVVMSVCVGAYRLAETGLLSGKTATTNNGAYVDIQRKYPDVHFLLNRRWVQSDPVIFTSGATGAGIDLALHVVDLYFGREVAARAAGSMNYPGQDWKGDGIDSLKSPLPSDRFSTGVLGNWQGEVSSKEEPLQLAIHIWPYPDDKHLAGTVDVLNRNDIDLFIDPIALNGPDLHFEIHNGASTYDGKLNAEGTAIEGTWKHLGASTPLVLKRAKK